MQSERSREVKTPEPAAIEALGELRVRRVPDVVLRTRRAVMEAANGMQAQRARSRKQMGVVLFSLGALLMLLTPAIWAGVDDIFGGEHLMDMPAMVLSMVLLLFTTVFAVLIMSWSRRKRLHGNQ